MATIKSIKVVDESNLWRLSYSSTKGFCGNLGTKDHPFGLALIELDDTDRQWLQSTNVAEQECCMRITSERFAHAGLTPMIKFSKKTNRVYFLSDEGKELDLPLFEKKGVQVTFLNIKDGSNLDKFVNY